MRLPIISPDKLTDEQKTLADDMKEGIAKSFQGFVNIRDDGRVTRSLESLAARAEVRQAGLGIVLWGGREDIGSIVANVNRWSAACRS